ncbi:MAG: hypothetical protein M1817_001506 [Caeruleum heppii]|nr:MAG: hypothetical protein M1817_001506 [Caeruleum heppii]
MGYHQATSKTGPDARQSPITAGRGRARRYHPSSRRADLAQGSGLKACSEHAVPVGPSPQPQVFSQPSEPPPVRKRAPTAYGPSSRIEDQPSPKRRRVSPSRRLSKEGHPPVPATEISESDSDPIQYWIANGRWRDEYFVQDSQVKEDFLRGKSPDESDRLYQPEEHHSRAPLSGPMASLQHLLARKKSSAYLRRKFSESDLRTPSDQLPREVKSAPYRTSDYAVGLEAKGSFMNDLDDDNIPPTITDLSRILLETEQTIPQDSLFRDDVFKKTCRKMVNRNEAMIIQDITRLIVPSAQNLAIYGATHLNHLYECVNEGWNSAIPFHGTRPQPDYSVGFARSAFTTEQLKRLEPFVGDILYGSKCTTFFMATTRMYFPFLTCEVKCGAAALDVADRQNAHSMTVAVKGLVELFRAVKREQELHGHLLAFSISHDDCSVRIYGHYPMIQGDQTSFHRHPLTKYDFTNQEGRERWTGYKFTKNVFDYSVKLHQRICSAIDDLPTGIDFSLSQSASFSQSEPLDSPHADVESTTMPDAVGSQSGSRSQGSTPTTSVAPTTERASKKSRDR